MESQRVNRSHDSLECKDLCATLACAALPALGIEHRSRFGIIDFTVAVGNPKASGFLQLQSEPFSTAERSERVEHFLFCAMRESNRQTRIAQARGAQIMPRLCGTQQTSKCMTSLLNIAS